MILENEKVRRGQRCRVSGVACALALALGGLARAEDAQPTVSAAITFSPDGERVLINRDVGDERWAITRNDADGTLTGNVYHEDGRPPQFVWCLPTSAIEDSDPARARYIYDCYGTTPCDETSCPDWTFVSEVTLNGRFFLPPGGGSPKPAPSPTPKPTASPAKSPAATPTPAAPTSTPIPTPARTATPAPAPTSTRGPLVVTPDKVTIPVSTSSLFVITGGEPPYSVYASSGGEVAPGVVARAGSPFTFTAGAVPGSTTIIVVDQAQTLKTVAVTVK